MKRNELSHLQEIKIGIIGIGAMGKGLLYQSMVTPAIVPAVICDHNLPRCISALEEFGLPYKIVDRTDDMIAAIEAKYVAVCCDGNLLVKCPLLSAVIEATGTIIPAAGFAFAALENKKHLILMNSEIDLIFGPLLRHTAQQNGVVCTSCDGDQYGAMKHLIDDIHAWGFELVMAGNIKGFLDRYANPAMIEHEARIRNLDVRACTSYTDGTKLNIEMALIANEIGMKTSTPGMQGPICSKVQETLQLFDLANLWEPGKPLVDYILGAEPGGGIFIIGHNDNPYQQKMLKYYKMGEGPFYLFYRNYHLCHIEAMNSVISAVRFHKTLMMAKSGFQTNVYSYAKRDLPAGTILDGIGGFNCYGLIENVSEQGSCEGLPICLADNISLKNPIKKGQRILLTDVFTDNNRLDFKLFRQSMSLESGR